MDVKRAVERTEKGMMDTVCFELIYTYQVRMSCLCPWSLRLLIFFGGTFYRTRKFN